MAFRDVEALGFGKPFADSGLDVVIDTVGGDALAEGCALLRTGGRLVTLSAPPSQQAARDHHVHAMFFVASRMLPSLPTWASWRQRDDCGRWSARHTPSARGAALIRAEVVTARRERLSWWFDDTIPAAAPSGENRDELAGSGIRRSGA
jgi:NADPH:quinone reductase-like Zn-dependent oxidoreductase